MRFARSRLFILAILATFAAAEELPAGPEGVDGSGRASVMVILTGVGGRDAYRDRFANQAAVWQQFGEQAGWTASTIATESVDGSVDERLSRTWADLSANPPERLVVVLIGHGTDDGRIARFNIPGDDVSADSMRKDLDRIDCRQLIFNTTAASGAWIAPLSSAGRVVITATKNGREVDATQFADALSAPLRESDAGETSASRGPLDLMPLDLDKDDAVSVLELAVYLSDRTAAAYRDDNRIATEHALIDDNGDGRGTRLDAFAGTHLRPDVDRASDDRTQADGDIARDWILAELSRRPPLTEEQLATRRQLETQLETIKARRPPRVTDTYLAELEAVFRQLADVYQNSGE